MYYTGTPEFEFGDGLSYDKWEVELVGRAQLQATLYTAQESHANFTLQVSNRGSYGGGLTVLAFWRPKGHSFPLKQKLFAFDGIRDVAPGRSSQLQFTLKSEHLAIADNHGHQFVNAGKYEVVFKFGTEQSFPLLRVDAYVRGDRRLVQAFEG